jgi:hypothetical protein
MQTGQQTLTANIIQGGKADNVAFTPVTWRATVYQPKPKGNDASRTELSLWFDTNGANYTDNYSLGWDACYFWMLPFTINTFLRGQKDPGDCSATLNQACLNDLKGAVNSATRLLVSNPTPGPDSNLTTNSLPGVCSKIASMVTQQFPSSCAVFFDGPASLAGGAPSLGGALTGPKSIVSASQCKTKYGSLVWNQFGGADNATYTLGNWWVTALLTTYMPIADYARPVTLPAAVTFATCLRADNVSADSYVPPDTPSPTALSNAGSPFGTNNNNTSSSANTADVVPMNRGLTGGAIAGIAIGIIIGILIGAALAFLVFRRRQRKQKERQDSTGTARTASSSAEMEGKSTLLRQAPSEAPNMNAYYEMSSPQYTAELPNKSFQAPVELPAQELYDPPRDGKTLGQEYAAPRR